METTTKAKKLISEAGEWTFAGDCSLLQWMEEIGRHLEQSAVATNQSLDALTADINQTGIALENVVNSLDAMQHTQFVENRVYDEDETVSSEIEMETIGTTVSQPKADNDAWNSLLAKNLKVLHKYHDRFCVRFDDSDDEDVDNSYVYQPNNRYNQRPLPHIYGSALWTDNWHVGLCDGDNDYSSDETSEVFSEASTSAKDNESLESNIANLSAWPSSTTIGNERFEEHHRGLKEILLPENEQEKQEIQTTVNTQKTTDTNLVEPKSIVRSSAQDGSDAHGNLFTPIYRVPSATSLSVNKSLTSNTNIGNVTRDGLDSQTPISDVESIGSLAVDDIKSSTGSSRDVGQPQMKQILRRPVNLFDDDDFKSFMTEVMDKVKDKKESPSTKALDEEAHSASSAISTKQSQTINEEKSFKDHGSGDVVTNSNRDDTIKRISAQTITDAKQENRLNVEFNSASLFDDDDDDDCFFSSLSLRKSTTPKRVGRTILFDDDKDAKGSTKSISNKLREMNLFDEDDDVDPIMVAENSASGSRQLNSNKMEETEPPRESKDWEAIERKGDAAQPITSHILKNNDKVNEGRRLSSGDVKTIHAQEIVTAPCEEIVEKTQSPHESSTSLPQSIAKPTIKAYCDLFFDEPPDDEDKFFQSLDNSALMNSRRSSDLDQDIYESSLKGKPAERKAPSATGGGYGGLGLFSDVPPEDDVEYTDAEKHGKITGSNQCGRLHSIFYDDFAETVNAVNKREVDDAARSCSIFDNEPPPDEVFEEIYDNKENRLNAALEPSISGNEKLPTIAKTKFEGQSSSASDSYQENVTFAAIKGTQSKADLLINVCKDRVRITSKRRPSTRKGRQDNYQRSLREQEQEIDVIKDEDGNDKTIASLRKEQNTVTVGTKRLTLNSEETTAQDTFKTVTVAPERLERGVGALPDNVPGSKNITSDLNLFENDSEDEGGLFFNVSSTLSDCQVIPNPRTQFVDNNENTHRVPSGNSIYADKTAGDRLAQGRLVSSYSIDQLTPLSPAVGSYSGRALDFVSDRAQGWSLVTENTAREADPSARHRNSGNSVNSLDESRGNANVSQANPTTPTRQGSRESNKNEGTNKALTLFSSDDENENDDDFMKVIRKPSKTGRTKAVTLTDSKGLFSDTDSDDDDLFGTKKTEGIPRNVSVENTALRRSSTAMAQAGDNPLADLLND